MTALESAIDHISKEIKKYRELSPDDGEGMVACLQQISSTLFYLEKERADYHVKFQNIIHENVFKGESVARSENIAHKEVPEMYLLRRIMDSAYKTCDAIRTQISWIKSGIVNA